MNTAGLRAQAARWLEMGCPAVVVELRSVKGSVPREAGTRMVVSGEAVLGTIGGGHLEWRALNTARALLRGASPWPAPERVPLGPALGQCCGGVVELAFEPLDAAALERWRAPEPRFHLMLYGAGHVGQALVKVLGDLDVTVDWVDGREGAFARFHGTPSPARDDAFEGGLQRFAGLRCVETEDPVAEARSAPSGSHHLVMTHSHALDFDIVLALLRRPDTGLVGLIGSKTKRQQFEHRLLERGLAAQRVADLVCPVGLAGIAGKEPAAVAVAVAAQLLSLPAQAHQPGATGLL